MVTKCHWCKGRSLKQSNDAKATSNVWSLCFSHHRLFIDTWIPER